MSTTRSRKNKAVQLQNYVAEKIREAFHLNKEECYPSLMGESGVDIKLNKLARKRFPWSIECKAQAVPGIPAAMEQAKKNSYSDTSYACVWKPKGRGPQKALVILELDDFIRLTGGNTLEVYENKSDNVDTLGDRDFAIAQEWSELAKK